MTKPESIQSVFVPSGTDDLPPLVKPGTYEVVFVEYETALMFGGNAKKVVLWFRIVTQGPEFGKLLPRYYNAETLYGRRGRNGRFRPPKSGDFLREFYRLFGGANRLDRIPMGRFVNGIFEAEVDTVSESRGEKLPEALRYSRIAKLVRKVQ